MRYAIAMLVLLAMTCAVHAADEPTATLAPGTYTLKMSAQVVEKDGGKRNDKQSVPAELTVKDETITLTVNPPGDDRDYVFTGTIVKGVIRFSIDTKQIDEPFTISFEGKVKSDKEASGTFMGSVGDEKMTGTWSLAP